MSVSISLNRSLLAVLAVSLAACSGGSYKDLDQFMANAKAKPTGHIAPIPAFQAYKSFTYSATSMRSPFDKPVKVTDKTRMSMKSHVRPDPNRPKEYLERFSLDSLSMVGSVEKNGVTWALVQDADGNVHRVKKGNYMGRNNGRIVEATDSYISILEIVPNGADSWVERPRTIKLKTSEEK